VPQLPQLALLFAALTHTPPHSMVPVGQTHDPLMQIFPSAQALPQAPQLFGSLSV
jgi:hypothetical protein